MDVEGEDPGRRRRWTWPVTVVVTLAVLAIALGDLLDAMTTVEGELFDFFHTVSQRDITDHILRSVVAGVAVFALCALLAWWYEALGVTRWTRFPALLVALYALVAGVVTFAELGSHQPGSVGPRLTAVKVAGTCWFLLGVLFLLLAWAPRLGRRFGIARYVVAFALLAGTISLAAIAQHDVAAEDVSVATPPRATASQPCAVVGGDEVLLSWDEAGRVRRTSAPGEVMGVARGEGTWVAVGAGLVMVSRDGRHWSTGEPIDDLHDVAWGGRRWVTVGAHGVIRTSDDARTWVRVRSGTVRDLRSVATDGHLWVAVGDRIILTSTDGLTWQPQPSTVGINALLHDSSGWVAVGGDPDEDVDSRSEGGILVSADGRTWSITDVGGPEWVDVASNGSQLLSVGSATVVPNGDILAAYDVSTILASNDGRTWDKRGEESLDAVTWDGRQWLALSGQSVMASSDGAAWSTMRTWGRFLNTIAATACRAEP
jgi:hypothetical protein